MLRRNLMLAAAFGVALFSGAAYAADPVSIVYIPKNTGNPYFDSIIKGFEDGCKTLGCDFTTVAPASAEATSQIPFVTAQIQRGVNVVAISPNSPDALNQVFDRARGKGTIILSVNSDMPGNEAHRDAAILPVDFTKTGPSQVELLGKQIGYEGEIAILSATTDAPDQNVWIAAMKETLEKDPKYAKMKLVTIAYGDDDPQKSTTETEALLANYPNLKGIISPTTVGVAAAAQVVETAKKADKVKVVGLGTPNQMRRFIENGTVEAFQLWSPYNQGLLAANFAVGVKNGSIKNEAGTVFEVPGLGKVTVEKDSVIKTQADLTTFDKSNIADFNF
ncbi:substrate-binding domain-containing protein [Kaistia nematophila]|uniref:Substrate-binding domain-containing protein n=1 Tax=Kaistia nematophila TaxID=2994654 RepID=A0A9X3DZ32_9HYPH|nr:substrate-binding domain-containing protein [Kaistia nematophila]MCX5568081.1 substrate-binding domain-containing protein [Kaistia nematophila]